MDSMKIVKGGKWSKVTTPFIERELKKKTGVEANLDFGLEATTDDNGKTHVHIDLEGDLSEKGWEQLLRLIGVPKVVTKFL